MSDFYLSVSFYCLPFFNEECRLSIPNHFIIRDCLTCNPANHHVALCGQYDPHYETREYKMCWPKGRSTLYSKILEGNYDRYYLLFRTCKKNVFQKINSHFVAGLYEVDVDKTEINPDYLSPKIMAKRVHFTSIIEAVNIDYFYKKNPNPKSRFPFNSETRGGIYHDDLSMWVDRTLNTKNYIDEYINETNRLTNIYLNNEFSKIKYYPECEKCINKKKCPLIKRIDNKNKVRYYLEYDSISDRILKKSMIIK